MHNQNKNKNLEYHSVVSRAHASTKVVDVAKFIVTIKEAPGGLTENAGPENGGPNRRA